MKIDRESVHSGMRVDEIAEKHTNYRNDDNYRTGGTIPLSLCMIAKIPNLKNRNSIVK